jgi:hypothetical protein
VAAGATFLAFVAAGCGEPATPTAEAGSSAGAPEALDYTKLPAKIKEAYCKVCPDCGMIVACDDEAILDEIGKTVAQHPDAIYKWDELPDDVKKKVCVYCVDGDHYYGCDHRKLLENIAKAETGGVKPEEPPAICPACGQIKGSALCCKPGAAKCPKCGLVKGSPGCCRPPKN